MYFLCFFPNPYGICLTPLEFDGFKIVSLKNSIRRYPCGENSISRCAGNVRGRIWEIVSGGIHTQQVSVREIVSAATCLYPDISLSVCGSWFTKTIFEMILFSVLLVMPFLLFFFTPACFTDTIFHRKAALLLYSSGALESWYWKILRCFLNRRVFCTEAGF